MAASLPPIAPSGASMGVAMGSSLKGTLNLGLSAVLGGEGGPTTLSGPALLQLKTSAGQSLFEEEDSQAFAELDEDLAETRGSLMFRPPTEVLPRTQRTVELQRRKRQLLRERHAAAEERRRLREQEEAQRRLRDQQHERRKKELEMQKALEARRREEEEEQRRKMEGGLNQLLAALNANGSAAQVSLCGIELGSVKLRLVTQAMACNASCIALDLSRKGCQDEDGVSVAEMLKTNRHLQKLELEGNSLGVRAAKALADALMVNQTLRALNLEGNNLTATGGDQTGVFALAQALKSNSSLRVLSLVRNHITRQGGERLVSAVQSNQALTMLDLCGNELATDQLLKLDSAVKRNCEALSALRRAERRERFALYDEEFQGRQHAMQVEALRLEHEATEERRLQRLEGQFQRWLDDAQHTARSEAALMEQLMQEAEYRKEARSKKGKKGKKK